MLRRLAVLMSLCACACDSAPNAMQSMPPYVSISITPSAPELPAGTSLELSAIGTYGDGAVVDVSSLATWTSSAPDVASVESAWITGMMSGSATITARMEDEVATVPVTITDGLQSLGITTIAPEIPAGRYRQLTAVGVFADSSQRDLTSQVTWSSDDLGVVAVSSYGGLAHGIAAGTTTVHATFGGIETAATFLVDPPVLERYEMQTNVVYLYEQTQFHTVAHYSDGSTVDLTEASTWTSDDVQVASVSDTAGTKGLVSGIGPGHATVVAVYGTEGTGALVDVQPRLLSITVSPPAASVAVLGKQQFQATGSYNDGSMVDLTSLNTWMSSNPNIATVSNDNWGEATGYSPGQVTISVSSGSVSGSAQLTVHP